MPREIEFHHKNCQRGNHGESFPCTCPVGHGPYRPLTRDELRDRRRTDPAAGLRPQLKALVEEREKAQDNDTLVDLTERIVKVQAEIRRRFAS